MDKETFEMMEQKVTKAKLLKEKMAAVSRWSENLHSIRLSERPIDVEVVGNDPVGPRHEFSFELKGSDQILELLYIKLQDELADLRDQYNKL